MGEEHWSKLPGGVAIEDHDDTPGSTCGAFNRRNATGVDGQDTTGIISAGHHVSSDGQTDPYMQQRNDLDDTIRVGEPTEWVANAWENWGFIDLNQDHEVIGWIADPANESNFGTEVGDGIQYDVKGIVPNSFLKQEASKDEADKMTFYTQGEQTGRTTGTVKKLVAGDSDGICDSVVTGADTAGGDSGGSMFALKDSDDDGTFEAFIAGEHFGAIKYGTDEDLDNCSDDAASTTAEQIEEALEGVFI